MSSIKYISLLLGLFFSGVVYGHNPKETYSVIALQDEQLFVRLEAPWSLQRAVKETYPEAKQGISAEASESYAKQYVLKCFRIYKNGVAIDPTRIELGKGEHSHSYSINLTYPITDLSDLAISNSLLFDLYPKQKNYHKINFADGKTSSFTTSVKTPRFHLSSVAALKGSPWDMYSFVFVGLVLVLGVSYQLASRRTERQEIRSRF